VGVVSLLVVIAADALVFVYTGVYVNLLTPALSVFFTFLVITVFKFIRTEQEKSYIRNAFSHYLSSDVINNLLDDPDRLELGGEQKYMTAMFTDVKGFSSISEKLDPTDLVKLLNEYLTAMSDTVLDLRGTIDKYEGDAIICFFGAPIEFEDHARRACQSAVRMRKIESELNKHFLENSLSPGPLLTRIGINTGDMVVGNMGTIKKMDYTIMGSAVNLASRLEGVNKQYGTWVLISQATYDAGGKDFTTRQMDRVRVVGINEPVRLYELIDEKETTDSKLEEAIDIFHLGQELFESKAWDNALKNFQDVLKILPNDGPANVFAERCKQYKKKPPPDTWDGVFNLTVK
jgi:adenylate cyclase